MCFVGVVLGDFGLAAVVLGGFGVRDEDVCDGLDVEDSTPACMWGGDVYNCMIVNCIHTCVLGLRLSIQILQIH